jgi:hypothetical protein
MNEDGSVADTQHVSAQTQCKSRAILSVDTSFKIFLQHQS